jgi:PIN domain nuclease of toxin-antitoxin system
MAAPPVLLDTCAAIWLMAGERLAPASLEAMRAAHGANAGVHVSAISAWEIATLVARGRLRLTLAPEHWFAALLDQPGVRLAELSPAILVASVALPGRPPRDSADRMIIATARMADMPIVTRDEVILAYAAAGNVQAIAC